MVWSLGVEVITPFISAIISLLLTSIIGAFVWYFRKYVVSQIEANSRHRRRAEGENPYKESGKLDRLEYSVDQLRETSKQEQSETRERLYYITEYVANVGDAINRSGIEQTVDAPDREYPDFYDRGDGDE